MVSEHIKKAEKDGWSVCDGDMRVSLIPFNPDEVTDKIWMAARTCYSKMNPEDLFFGEDCDANKSRFILETLSKGHFSVSEHQHFTFMISGVSRTLTHQLVRHRLANYSERSQRYLSLDKVMDAGDNKGYFVIPPEILGNSEALDIYYDAMAYSAAAYRRLKKIGISSEDARFVIGGGCKSNIVMTLNIRELAHICNERLCTNAQWEIRRMVNLMVKLIVGKLPYLKTILVPKCEKSGFCNEGEQRTCGRKPLKK